MIVHALALALLAVSPEGSIAAEKYLEGWTLRNGRASFELADGELVGRTPEGPDLNSFLCSDLAYRDFQMTFEVKLDPGFNSGIQLRSATAAGLPRGRVFGPQVEIASNGRAGHLYGEALGLGWFGADTSFAASWDEEGWNSYRILAEGQRIRTWVNGQAVADLHDDQSGLTSGMICLQVHAVLPGIYPPDPEAEGPFEVRFRKIVIEPLP